MHLILNFSKKNTTDKSRFKKLRFKKDYSNNQNFTTYLSRLIYLVNVKTMRKIVQIFVAFSEKLNFKGVSSV